MEGADGNILLDVVVCEIPEKYIQWRLTINVFRDREYVHLRKYFMDFEGEYVPSKEGACIEITVDRLANLFSALVKTLSKAEAVKEVLEHVDEETLQQLLDSAKSRGKPDVRQGDADTD